MDFIAERGLLFLGTRLKRLGERMQADVLQVVQQSGLPVQPSQYPILGAIDRHGVQSVGELVERLGISQPAITRAISNLVELDYVTVERDESDRRQKIVSLTKKGSDAMMVSRREVWPRVEAAVVALCEGLEGDLPTQLGMIETRLATAPLHAHVAPDALPELKIREYSNPLSGEFFEINAEWIEDMYRMEDAELAMLRQPRESYINGGGAILFVEAADLGIIGTCALRQAQPGWFELTKMGVRASARGRKAGEFLLNAAIARAEELGAETLFLLTNRKSQAAIHLYEKAGFVHDDAIMERFGAIYERCNVAMRYQG